MSYSDRFDGHCTRCGKPSFDLIHVPYTTDRPNGRSLCPECKQLVNRYPEYCSACGDLDGQPLVPMVVQGNDEKLCPRHYDELRERSYRTFINAGDDICADSFETMQDAMNSILTMMKQRDNDQYFPIMIQRFNQYWGIEEDVCLVYLDGSVKALPLS